VDFNLKGGRIAVWALELVDDTTELCPSVPAIGTIPLRDQIKKQIAVSISSGIH